jgi:hypothetical protein
MPIFSVIFFMVLIHHFYRSSIVLPILSSIHQFLPISFLFNYNFVNLTLEINNGEYTCYIFLLVVVVVVALKLWIGGMMGLFAL